MLRQDPDVILVGELRDLETISAACTAAETGHLVFGTLHTTSAPSTIDRMIDVFPPHQQEQIRMQLSITLQGVISQTLLPKIGGGRVAAHEIMVCLTSIANLIREAKTHQMVNIIQAGSRHGMYTLDQDLTALVAKGVVSYEEAAAKAQDLPGFEAQCGEYKGKRAAPAQAGWSQPLPPAAGHAADPSTGPEAGPGRLKEPRWWRPAAGPDGSSGGAAANRTVSVQRTARVGPRMVSRWPARRRRPGRAGRQTDAPLTFGRSRV